MGFWSSLGTLGGLIAAPFTGGSSLLLSGIGGAAGGVADSLTGAGQTAADIEKGRASGRIAQAGIQQKQDELAQARAKLALSAPGQEAGNAVRGDVLANSQDASVGGLPSYIHVGQVSGGLRPSMLSASSRALGANMSRNALTNNMSGADVPALTPLPASTGLDTTLNATAGAGGFLNALKGTGTGPTGSLTPPSTGDPNGPGFVQGGSFPNGIPEDPSQAIDPALLQLLQGGL